MQRKKLTGMPAAFRSIFKNRKIILATTSTDIKMKYAGATLGYLWLVLYPLLLLSIYAVSYIFIFKVRLKMLSPYEYVLLIFSGLIPFLSFTEAMGRGVTAVTANASLLKNTLFPIEFVPVNYSLTAQVIQLVGFSMLSILLFFMGRLGVSWFFIFLVWACQIVFTIGILWIISALNVFFKDLNNIIAIIILMLMLISPIAYTEDMIPHKLRKLLYLNPLYYLIMVYQKILIFNRLDIRLFGIFAVLAFFHFFFGYWLFMKLKCLFSDYV